MSIGFRRGPVAPRWFLFLSWLLTRRMVLKPIYRSVICNDLLGQAEHLREAGYYVASVALTRCWLERAINRLTLITPTWQSIQNRSFKGFVNHLTVNGVIDHREADSINQLYAITSKVVHGKETNSRKAYGLIQNARGVRNALERATINCLSRTNEDECDSAYCQLQESAVAPAEMAVTL